jgi:hypothetical protein
MGETVQNYPPLASTISPVSPNDRPRARAGKAGSETRPRFAVRVHRARPQGGGALGALYEALALPIFIPTGSPVSRSALSMGR